MSDWQSILQTAIERDGCVAVAQKLGYRNHTQVSLIARGHKKPSERFIGRVLSHFWLIQCPYLKRTIDANTCCEYAGRSFAAVAPMDMPHWRACKRCAHNPVSTAQEAQQ